ncbi:MAG: hypothetical protein Q4B54_14720 [Coriobacteriales bacterium]|nr:hypothetical protein [Coriobacteriales bacterium]
MLDAICRIRSDWRFVEERGYLIFFRVNDSRLYVDRVLRKLFGVADGSTYYL